MFVYSSFHTEVQNRSNFFWNVLVLCDIVWRKLKLKGNYWTSQDYILKKHRHGIINFVTVQIKNEPKWFCKDVMAW